MANFLFHNNIYAQEITNDKMSAISLILEGRGINQDDLIKELNLKGLDVETMTEADFILNKNLIEETVLEMEMNFENQSQDVLTDDPDDLEVLDEPIELIEPLVADEPDEPEEFKIPNTYGHEIFTNNSLKIYDTSKDASPPDSYILASGDKINILIFGKSQADYLFEVNGEGYSEPSGMPKIFIAGLTLKQAKEMIKKRFSNFYVFDKNQFALVLNTSRTISVNVFGEVFKPGSYTISALNTLLNTLSIAGGPTSIGSVRDIQIIRGNSKKSFDLYDFITNPSIKFDFFLQNNDIIYVPSVKKIVYLEGAVNRPMAYELKDNESINELIDFSGGLKSNASTGLIQTQTIENNKYVLKDYSLDEIISNDLQTVLNNGDKVKINYIPEDFYDFVSISGTVDYPGLYPLSSTQTLKSLIKKSVLKRESKTDLIFLTRKGLDDTNEIFSFDISGDYEDITLMKEDEIVIYDKADYKKEFDIYTTGEVRNQDSISVSYGTKISVNDAINLSKGFTKDAANFGYIFRTNPFDSKKTEYINVNFLNDLNYPLIAGDRLVVLNKNDFRLESSIDISGEIKDPITLRFDSSLTIKDVISLAKGPKISSDLTKVKIFRLTFEENKIPIKSTISLQLDKNYNVINSKGFKLMPYDKIVIRKIQTFDLQKFIYLKGQVISEGPFILPNTNYRFSDLVNDSGGYLKYADASNITLERSNIEDSTTSIISFDSNKAFNKPGSIHDPILIANDLITVPKIDNIISINKLGTNHPLEDFGLQTDLKIIYSGNYSAKYYINNFAGGFDKNADKFTTTVTRQNGKIKKTRKFLFINLFPRVNAGDRISVLLSDDKLAKKQKAKKPFNWDNFSTKIISFATIYTLLNQAINQ